MEWSHNITPFSKTGMSPYYVFFGRDPYLPLPVTTPEAQVHSPKFYDEMKKRVQGIHDEANRRAEDKRQREAEYYNRRTKHVPFEPGDRVWERVEVRGKLDPKWAGPISVKSRRPSSSGGPGTTYDCERPDGSTCRRNYEQLKRVNAKFEEDMKKPLVKEERPKEKSLAALYGIAFAWSDPRPPQMLPDVNPPAAELPAAEPPVVGLPAMEPPAAGPSAAEPSTAGPSTMGPPAVGPSIAELHGDPPITVPPTGTQPVTVQSATNPRLEERPAAEPPVVELPPNAVTQGAHDLRAQHGGDLGHGMPLTPSGVGLREVSPPGSSTASETNTVIPSRASYSDWSEDEDDDGGSLPSIPPILIERRGTGEVGSPASEDGDDEGEEATNRVTEQDLDNAFYVDAGSPGGLHAVAIVTPTAHPRASPESDPDDISPLLLSPSQRPDFNETRAKTVTHNIDLTNPNQTEPHYKKVRRKIHMPHDLVVFRTDDKGETGEVDLDATPLARTFIQSPGVSPVDNTFLYPPTSFAVPSTSKVAAGPSHSRPRGPSPKLRTRHRGNGGNDDDGDAARTGSWVRETSSNQRDPEHGDNLTDQPESHQPITGAPHLPAEPGSNPNARRPQFNPPRGPKGRFIKVKK